MLIVVRHGRTPANASGQLLGRRDPDLDEVGRAQAASIATAITESGAKPTILVCSPLKRCADTAQAIAEAQAVQSGVVTDITIDRRFIEIDYGDLEGTAVADVPPDTWERWRSDPDWAPGGGESLVAVSRRVGAALDELVASHKGSDVDIVVVTHVSPIKAAIGWSLGVGPEIAWRTHVEQASIHRIDITKGSPRLISFNETHHLRA